MPNPPGPPRPPRPPRPGFPRPPHPFEPDPWTPFGPTDQANPNAADIVAEAQKIRSRLEDTRAQLEKMRRGPGSKTPPHDGSPPPGEVSRADGLWPFLLIRSYPGDFGARPLGAPDPRSSSPDIVVVTPPPPGSVPDAPVLWRDDFNFSRVQSSIVSKVAALATYDVWVHVWNLGRAPAHGVRVRAWGFSGAFLGGGQLDLGDRTSSTSHAMVKIGSWVPSADEVIFALDGELRRNGSPVWIVGAAIRATAECMSDVADGSRNPIQDRHSAFRGIPFP